MTFSAPIMSPMFAEADGVGDRAGRDDRALAGHQARDRGDRADAAGVGERDVRAGEVVGGAACSCAPCRSSASNAALKSSKLMRPASRMTGTISVRRAVLLLDVDGDAEVHGAVVDAVRLAVDLVEVVGHHRHVVLGGRARWRRRSGG